MLKSARHVVIPGRTAKSVSVQVPVNPAHYLHVYPVDENATSGATAGVYKFRTQQCSEKLLILYANVGDEPVTLTIGEVIAEANMCSLGTKIKPGINSIAKQVDKNRAQELWNKSKLNDNELVSNDLKPDLFALITEYSDVFADEYITIGNTSWVNFRVELKEHAQPVKQKVRPLPPPL